MRDNMEFLEKLISDIWFGEKTDGMDKEIEECIRVGNTESAELLKLIKAFKLGDFSQKTKLIELLQTSENEDILNIAIRLFISVATPDDFSAINDLFVDKEEETVRVFVSFAEESLSYQIIPYLLGLLSIWKDTELGEEISFAIGSMLGYDKATYELCSEDELGQKFVSFSEDKDLSRYYYDGNLAFAGNLTKKLIEETMIARTGNGELEDDTIPSLLSIWSGIKCPADYYTVVNDSVAGEIMEYVKKIAAMSWDKGCKYFYGNKIG